MDLRRNSGSGEGKEEIDGEKGQMSDRERGGREGEKEKR